MIDSYKSLFEALIYADIHTNSQINTIYIDLENIEKQGTGILANMDTILTAGGFGKRSVEGKLMTINSAQMNYSPYLGICLDMELAVVEYARNEISMKDSHNTLQNSILTPVYPVIRLITE